jgi:hypothetical protein
MTTRRGFGIEDFAEVLRAAGEDLVLMGGQAVSLWANEYKTELALTGPVLSKDIDFWGDRQLLTNLAKRLGTKADYPEFRSFTVLSGLVRKVIKGELVHIDVLHTVPGLDQVDPAKAAVKVTTFGVTVTVLDPISMIATKFHNLRNFDQTERNDEAHLRLCIPIAALFTAEAFVKRGVRMGLSYVKRILDVALVASNQRTIKEYSLRIYDAVPVETIRRLSKDERTPAEERQRLLNFMEIRWARLQASGEVS